MSTDREQLKNLRVGIAQHFEDAATLFQSLPPEEHELYLTTAIGAWNLVAKEPLTAEMLQGMIETLFAGEEDDDEPISATGSGESAQA
jgi:hypothetical protein